METEKKTSKRIVIFQKEDKSIDVSTFGFSIYEVLGLLDIVKTELKINYMRGTQISDENDEI